MPTVSFDFKEASRPATYRDALDAPLHMIAQIIDGNLHLLPGPAYWHAKASCRIGRKIGGPYEDGVVRSRRLGNSG